MKIMSTLWFEYKYSFILIMISRSNNEIMYVLGKLDQVIQVIQYAGPELILLAVAVSLVAYEGLYKVPF